MSLTVADLKVGMVIRDMGDDEIRTVTAIGQANYLYLDSEGREFIGRNDYLGDYCEVGSQFEVGKTYEYTPDGFRWTVLFVDEDPKGTGAAFARSGSKVYGHLTRGDFSAMTEVD